MMCCFVAQIYYRNLEKTKESEEKCNAADADHCTYNLFYTGFLLEYQRVRPYDKHGGESHDGGCETVFVLSAISNIAESTICLSGIFLNLQLFYVLTDTSLAYE